MKRHSQHYQCPVKSPSIITNWCFAQRKIWPGHHSELSQPRHLSDQEEQALVAAVTESGNLLNAIARTALEVY
jgi:hypothetical protein